jgi:hypothetical protein
MKPPELVLEYFKVFLSTQVVAGVVAFSFIYLFREDIKALLLRITKIRLPGGTDVSTPQSPQLEDAPENKPLPNPSPQDTSSLALPQNLDQKQTEDVKQLLDAERARSYLWEYRYLNYYLAYRTQQVLDWFASLPTKTSLSLFDTLWLPLIPSTEERRNIINALHAHDLIRIDNDLVDVTPKGHQYKNWRGLLPEPKKD